VHYLKEEIPNAVHEALDGVARVSKIVRAMKEFSHPSSSDMIPVDINKAIETTLAVARNEWRYVAEIKTDLDPTLPLVPCMAGEINQVLLNLIINAAHTIKDVVGGDESEKGLITIRTSHMNNHLELRIGDTGTGIPKDIRDRIFEPFFTTKEVGKGSGQGLAMAHHMIVKKHQGELTFETEEEKGTTFIVRLPISGNMDDQ
jgi:signal transduction histidine kinase